MLGKVVSSGEEGGKGKASPDKRSGLVLVTHRSGLPFHGSPLFSSFPFVIGRAHIPQERGGAPGEPQLRGCDRAGTARWSWWWWDEGI